MQDKPTLCWKCAKACGECSWSDGTFTSVDGWNAIPTVIHADHGRGYGEDVPSFIVAACPQFDDDSGKYKKSTPIPTAIKPKPLERPFRTRTVKGSLRDRIWHLSDREQRIDRLDGEKKRIAELVFRMNNTMEDVCERMYLSQKAAKRLIKKAMEEMEAMS